ncbi:MAG: hypothetical protein KF691_03955 [Phycisphaeraceae bacterium]|nr:hypothetical protein [Phycisphaeraceae bacterium]
MNKEPGLSSEESAALLDRPAKRAGRGRRILMVLGGIVLILLVIVALLPRLASPFLNGRTVLNSDRVHATIASSSLGWFGDQQVRLALTDAKAKPAGNLNVSIDRGLLALAGNWYNLGTIRITGDAELREGAGASAPKPTSGGTTVSVTTDRIPLPKDLQARIEMSLSKVGVIDAAGATVAELRDVKTVANIRIGEPLTIDFDAKSGASPISANVKVENWVQPDGSIHLDSASLAKNSPKVNASVKMDDLSVALVDALVATATGQERHLKSILGETVSIESQASGDFGGGNASLNLRSAGAQANAQFALKDGVVSLVKPAHAKITSAGTRAILDNYVPPSTGGFVVTSAPDTEFQIEELSLKLPTAGLDLRNARVRGTATLANTAGTIALGEGQPPSKVSIPAFKAALASEDLAGVVRVTADAESTIATGGNTASGGDLKADISASGLLDANGAPRSGLPGAIDGRVALRGAATGILQPIVSGALASSGVALDLPRDIGPTADVDLTAKTESGVIDLDVNARAQSAEAIAELRVTDQALAARGKGISLRLANAGAIAARTLKSPNLSLANPSGQLSLDVTSLNLPLESGTRKPKLDQLAAQAKATLSGWSLTAQVPPGKDQVRGRPVAIDLRALNADVALAPGKGAVVRVDSDASTDGAPVKIAADLSLPHALDSIGAPKPGGGAGLAQKLGPALAFGHVEVSGLPATLADALPRSAQSATTMGALVREAVGDTVTISLDSSRGADAQAMSVKANVQGARTSAGVNADINSSAIVAIATGKGTLTPGLLDALVSGNAADKPRLRAPVSYSFSTEPLSVPLDAEGSPVLAKAGVLKAKASIPGQAIVQSGAQAYGLQDFAIQADMPLSALGEGSGGQAAASAGGVLLSADGSSMGNLDAKATLPLGANLTLAGPANVEVGLSGMNTAGLDRALGQPLLVSGALGPSATIRAATRISPPSGAAIGVAEAFSKADLAADITLASQRLEIKKPLHARAEGDRLSLESPEPITWTIDPAWFDRFVLGKGQGKQDTDLSLAAPARAELVVSKAVIARTNTERGIQGPAFPGVFALDATARLPSLELVDSRSVRTQMGDAVLKVLSGPASPGQPISLAFDLGFGKLAVVPDPAKSGPGGGTIKGTISGISTPTGLIEASNPIITAKGDIRSLPSALVDAFSVKNGLPGEILGPSVNVALDAQNFSKAGGSVSFSAKSTETGAVSENGATTQRPRAEMSLKGNAQNGVLVAPLNITLRRVDLGLEKRLSDVLPMIADVEKRYEDKQAVISSPQLAIPLDGNTAKLNGTLNIDPGDARFKTSGTFGALLRAIKTKDQGKIFQRLKPLNLSITDGVITYPRWTFPMGEFNMDIEGTVDLPQSYVDMVAWVPVGQLVEDVAGVFNRIPGVGTAGNMINQSTMVPIRFKGPMGQTKAAPDAAMFGKNFIKNVNPEKAVDLIKDIFKRPK